MSFPPVSPAANSSPSYGPAALMRYASSTIPPPLRRDIDRERITRRLYVHKDGNDQLQDELHSHFCANLRHRETIFNDAVEDMKDVATGLDRLTDGLFIGFAISADWDKTQLLHPSKIELHPILSRHFSQYPAFRATLTKIEDIVREELALPHICSFPDKLNSVTPGAGYRVPATAEQRESESIRLAPSMPAPSIPAFRPRVVHFAHPSLIPAAGSPLSSGSTSGDTIQELRSDATATSFTQSSLPRSQQEHLLASTSLPQATHLGRARLGQHRREEIGVVLPGTDDDDVLAENFRALNIRRLVPFSSNDDVAIQSGQVVSNTGLAVVETCAPYIARASTQAAERSQMRERPPFRTESMPAANPQLQGSSTSSPSRAVSRGTQAHAGVHHPAPAPPRRSRSALAASTSQRHLSDSPPPSYGSLPARRGDLQQFRFSSNAVNWLIEHEVSADVCMRIEAALPFEPKYWFDAFTDAGLTDRQAWDLRAIIEREIPDAMREALGGLL